MHYPQVQKFKLKTVLKMHDCIRSYENLKWGVGCRLYLLKKGLLPTGLTRLVLIEMT